MIAGYGKPLRESHMRNLSGRVTKRRTRLDRGIAIFQQCRPVVSTPSLANIRPGSSKGETQ